MIKNNPLNLVLLGVLVAISFSCGKTGFQKSEKNSQQNTANSSCQGLDGVSYFKTQDGKTVEAPYYDNGTSCHGKMGPLQGAHNGPVTSDPYWEPGVGPGPNVVVADPNCQGPNCYQPVPPTDPGIYEPIGPGPGQVPYQIPINQCGFQGNFCYDGYSGIVPGQFANGGAYVTPYYRNALNDCFSDWYGRGYDLRGAWALHIGGSSGSFFLDLVINGIGGRRHRCYP